MGNHFEDILIPVLFPSRLNGRSMLGGQNRLLGGIRVRQVRVKPRLDCASKILNCRRRRLATKRSCLEFARTCYPESIEWKGVFSHIFNDTAFNDEARQRINVSIPNVTGDGVNSGPRGQPVRWLNWRSAKSTGEPDFWSIRPGYGYP